MYSEPIINNAHRGGIVEVRVLEALGPAWETLGLGWHPWDSERGSGAGRDRLQVKQCAARQLWTERHGRTADVKAASAHGLRVVPRDGGWEIGVTLDV